MATTERSRGESQEALIRRFLRKIKKSEMLKELWDRRYYKKPSAVRNEKNRKRKRVLEKNKKEKEMEKEI